ncbi:hypothetical protein ACHWQZ_G013838 [Mnemiopsis leidyi]
MSDRLNEVQSENANLSIESEKEFPGRTTKKDYTLLLLVTLIKLGDGVEIYLPGVITQKASCELGVSDFEEGLLAVILYFFYAAAILVSFPISSRLGEKLTLFLSLYLSIIFAILCAVVPNYYTLLLSRALTGLCAGLNCATCGIFFAKLASSKRMVEKGSFLFEALAIPVGGTWVTILGWLFLDLVGWRVFILLTSIPLFIPPILMLHCCFQEQEEPERGDSNSDERKTPSETDTLVDSVDVPNFAARVTRSSLFFFSSLCIGLEMSEEQSSHEVSNCHAYLTLTDNSLTLGSKPHNHPADNAAPFKREVLSTLKRKAAEQPLSVTQNILSEVLADSTPETNQTLPTMESLARVVQRIRAVSSGSAQHTEATSSDDLEFH